METRNPAKLSKTFMSALRKVLPFVAALAAGCAAVTTHVVTLNPAQSFPPSRNVEILLEKPQRPYTEIALLESRGEIGIPEADLLRDIRAKAEQLGADAVVRIHTEQLYQPPIALYDPWYDPFFYPYYRRPWYPVGPYADYRLVGGGYFYVVKALAIRFKPPDKVGSSRAP